ncbi:unnamed protein product [Aphanomyces euteiches]
MSALDIKKYRGIGVQAAQDLIDFTRLTNGPIDWVLHTHSKAVQMYTARHENIPIFCLLSEIEASLDDIIAIFLKTTTADLRQTNSAFFPNLLDKVRLANVTLPSDDRPNHCLGSSSRRPSEHQDECIIDGKRAWIKAVRSVDIKGCPNLDDAYGIVRAEFKHSGFIFMETETPGSH